MNYGTLAKGYDEKYKSEQSQRENAAIKELLETYISKETRVLDLGCGTGFFLDLLPTDNYIGLDISADMLEVARGKHKGARFMQVSAKDTGEVITPYSQDCVASLFSIPYIGADSVMEIKKVLKPNGHFIGVYYNKPYTSKDSVYYGHKWGYRLSILPRVKRFVRKLKKESDGWVVYPLVKGEKGYNVIVCTFNREPQQQTKAKQIVGGTVRKIAW